MGRAARSKHVPPPAWTPFEPGVFPPGVQSKKESTWLNSRYQVDVETIQSNVPDAPPMTVLSIKRRDKSTVHDWRDVQRIKNEVLGPEWEGVELYPAESRLVDTANQYWLWCLPPGHRWPFGFDDRVVSEVSVVGPYGSGSRQRRFEVKPADLETPDSARVKLELAGMTGYRVQR